MSELTFTVPETDFDGINLEIAMDWVEAKFLASPLPQDEHGARQAHKILKLIHDRYMDAIGQPEWKKPALPG